LKLADNEGNRVERPWIFVVAHYPLYCGSEDSGCKENTA